MRASAKNPAPLPPSGERLLVSEKFVSIQGEGASMGTPAAFLRLGNCNLTCTYCDTAYTWDESRFDLSAELRAESLDEVGAWVEAHAPGRLIITGGEPLLQQKQLTRLLAALDEPGQSPGRARLFVEVETNGTVRPLPELLLRIDQWNVSPKLGNSGVPREKRIKPTVLPVFRESGAYFKFVVRTESDAREVDALVQEFALMPEHVLLMPEASDAQVLRARSPEVKSWALARGMRFSGRLHLELFGARRGV